MAEVKIFGRVRQVGQAIDTLAKGVQEQLALNSQLALLVAPDGAAYDEITRTGRSFKAGTLAAVPAVVAIPTTAVGFAIYNNEPEGAGRAYFIDRVWAQNVASTAASAQAQLLALVGQVSEPAPTDAMPANTLLSLCGTAGKDTKVRAILTATPLPGTTGLQGYWMPVGASGVKPGIAPTPGYGCVAEINGRIVCPPKRYFAVHVLANVVGETFQLGIEWHEKVVDLG